MKTHYVAWALAVFTVGCTDNPTAIADLNPEVEFDIEASRVETFEAVVIEVTAVESGIPMMMQEVQLRVRHAEEHESRVVKMEWHGDGFKTSVYFYEEGEHHIEFVGMLEGHTIMAEFGEIEVFAYNQRELVGPYWLEIEIPGGPIREDATRPIHVLVFDLLPDSTRGAPVGDLTVDLAVHSPDDVETELSAVEKEVGEYEVQFMSRDAGLYELHVEIEVAPGVLATGEFHLPVHSDAELDGEVESGDDQEGDGHGH